jgi:hypothetical protein
LINTRLNSIGTMTTLKKTKALWNQIPPHPSGNPRSGDGI